MDTGVETLQNPDIRIATSINTALQHLVNSGIYNFQSEQDIKRINLATTSSVTEVLAQSDLPLKDVLSLLHKAATLGQKGISEGFREKPVYLMGYYPPVPDEIPKIMSAYTAKLKELITNPENQVGDNPEKVATWAYFLLTSIHPFQDGNGRTARSLVEYIMLKMGKENPTLPSVRSDFSRGDDSLMLDATLQAGFAMTYEQSLKSDKKEVAGETIKNNIINTSSNAVELYTHHPELSGINSVLFNGRSRADQKIWINEINTPQINNAVRDLRTNLKLA